MRPAVDFEAMSSPSESELPNPDVGDEATSLDELAEQLAGVEQALERLEDGTYWTDEVSGETLPDELLAEDPTARRNAPPTDSPDG